MDNTLGGNSLRLQSQIGWLGFRRSMQVPHFSSANSSAGELSSNGRSSLAALRVEL